MIRSFLLTTAVFALVANASTFADDEHQTGPFAGVKANTGHAIHSVANGRDILNVSDDFVIPDTPAPHWQVVDSSGNVYLLNQFRIKDGRVNRQITVPAYVKNIVKVQVWCSFAEVLLGEASFSKPMKMAHRPTISGGKPRA